MTTTVPSPLWDLPKGFKGCRVIMLESGVVIDVPEKLSPFEVLDRLFKKYPPDAKEKAAADQRWGTYHAAPQPKQPDADETAAPRGKAVELKRADVAAGAAPEPKRPGVRDTSMAAYR